MIEQGKGGAEVRRKEKEKKKILGAKEQGARDTRKHSRHDHNPHAGPDLIRLAATSDIQSTGRMFHCLFSWLLGFLAI
jgi:hypothetical protein